MKAILGMHRHHGNVTDGRYMYHRIVKREASKSTIYDRNTQLLIWTMIRTKSIP